MGLTRGIRLIVSVNFYLIIPADAPATPQRFINEGVAGHDQFIPRWEPSSGTALDAKIFPQNEKFPLLFTPLKLRDVEFKNRLWVSPMCVYSSKDGHASDFHLVHIGQYALGGAGAIMLEATAVVPEGRISPGDAGIWEDSHIPQLKRIVDFAHAFGTKVGIQLAHAGRKASSYTLWLSFTPGKPQPSKSTASAEENGWPENVQGPSPIPYFDSYVTPQEITLEGIQKVKDAFIAAIGRCKQIGFDFIEVHAAHGYLLHEFYSPISNNRTDRYDGSLENRTRFLREVVEESRKAWGDDKPLFVRISGDDVAEDIPERDASGEWRSWGPEQSKWLGQQLAELGVDLIDVSSGGNYFKSTFFKAEPGYQVPLAEAVKSGAPNVAVGSVGNLNDAKFNEQVLQDGKSDVIFSAREFLRRPYFALEAAAELGVSVQVPPQYQFGWYSKFYIPQPAASATA